MTKTEQAKAYCVKHPNAPLMEIQHAVGCSERTARRGRQEAGVFGFVNKPKILLLDIESSFLECATWGIFKQHLNTQDILKEWAILCWAAKWLYEPDIISQRVSVYEAIYRKDASIIKGIWKLVEEADIIIAHNAFKFDNRKLKARFIVNDLTPNKPYRIIDTLKVAQKEFAFSSHKLDFLNGLLEISRKKKTSLELWKRCVARNEISSSAEGDIVDIKYSVSDNKVALEEMEDYCRSDITALEELYLELRPWIRSHPPLGLYTDSDGKICPACGADEEHFDWNGYYYTPMGKYESFRCQKCKSIGRSRRSKMTPEKRKQLVVSTAR